MREHTFIILCYQFYAPTFKPFVCVFIVESIEKALHQLGTPGIYLL